MLHKQPKKFDFKKNIFKAGKYIIAAELLAFVGAYVFYQKLDDRDFRYRCRENCPFVLDYYYKVLELADKNNFLRATDETSWQDQKKAN